MEREVDYSELECTGVDKTSLHLLHPEGLTFYSRRTLHKTPRNENSHPRDHIVLIPKSEIIRQMEQLEGRIKEIEESWEYQALIDYDCTKLYRMRLQYAELKRLNQEMSAQLKSLDNIFNL